MTSDVLMGVFMPTNEHWHVGVVQNIVTDTPHERSPQSPVPPGPTDDESSLFFVGNVTDYLAGFTRNALHFAADLQGNWASS